MTPSDDHNKGCSASIARNVGAADHQPLWRLTPIPAFSDNYIWLLQRGDRALIVDPGQAEPVLDALQAQRLTLDAILLTHHHHDHVGGVEPLRAQTGAVVVGPAAERLPVCDQRVAQGDTVHLATLNLRLSVLDIPGHTAGHIGFFCDIAGFAPLLFCGDTLFAAGCGRLFEGTPAQMLDSLGKLVHFPQDTRICCAHEYTLSNLRWALQVEPDNPMLQSRWDWARKTRDAGLPTLPSTLALELQTNPFLRTAQPAVVAAASRHAGQPLQEAVAVFACLRSWKNQF